MIASLHLPRRAPRFPFGGVLAVGLLVWAAPLWAQQGATITNGSEFWAMPEESRKRPHPVDMEVVAYHYDPVWKLLYGESGGTSTYLTTSGQPLPIQSGQRVRLTGTVVPVEGFDGAKIKVTVVAEAQHPRPVPAAGRLAELAALNGRWVELEGHILSQTETDAAHLVAVLWSEGRRLELTILLNGAEPVPELTGAHVRLRGVYDGTPDVTGAVQSIKFWTPGTAHVQLLGWLADDARFKLPATPIEELSAAAGSGWVRISGRVQGQEPGASLSVRDDTAQVEIRTVQPGELPVGAAVEVIGRPVASAAGWTLAEPMFRRISDALSPRVGPSGLPVRMRLVDQVVQLPLAEAARNHPVTLRGVVTWHDERANEFYLQDGSGGVAVRRPPDVQVGYGTTVLVTGVTARGALRPVVEAATLVQTGAAPLPPPRRISLEQAISGVEEGRLVEMRGYVRHVSPSEGWTRLDLTARTGEFSAYLPPGTQLQDLTGAVVRVRGVCVAQPGPGNEPGDIRVWVRSRDQILVDVPGTQDPFAVEAHTIAQLRQLPTAQAGPGRVRVSGVVSLHRPGRYLYLQDEGGGLFVLTRETRALTPGDAIEVSALLGRAGNRPVLREATWRAITPRAGIAPRVLEPAAVIDPALDTQLVQTEAILRQTAQVQADWHLSMESDGRVFEVILPAPAAWRPPQIGSRLRLRGVYVVEFDEYRRAHNFQLQLRGPDDLAVLASPLWWTSRRVAWVVAGLGVAFFLAAGWVTLLRRRVRADRADPPATREGGAPAGRVGAVRPARVARRAGGRHRPRFQQPPHGHPRQPGPGGHGQARHGRGRRLHHRGRARGPAAREISRSSS